MSEKKRELELNCSNLSRENKELNEKMILLTNENSSSIIKIDEKKNELNRLENPIFLMEIKIETKNSKIHDMEKKIEILQLENKHLSVQFDEIKKNK